MGLALDHFLDRFETRIRDGKGWRVRCPAHDDNDPSLHVEESADGAIVLVKCRAGCATEDVVLKAGASMRELYESHWHSSNGSTKDRAAPNARGQGRPPFGKIVKIYDYHDERGQLLFQVLRDEHKNFRQRRPSHLEPPADPWTYELDNTRRVLYRLPEVLSAKHVCQRIYLPEGEKDADNLAALGLTATTSPQGAAAQWLPQYTDALAGAAEVVILPDNDEPGRKHAEKIRDALAEWVVSLKILALPELPEKGDVSDWIAAGGRVEELEALADAAEPYVTPSRRFVAAAVSLGEFMQRTYRKPPSLLGNGLICAGDLSILYGKPGLGKTFAIIQLVLELARGQAPFGLAPPEAGPLRPGVLELETHAGHFQERFGWLLEKAGGEIDRSRIQIVARPDLRGAVDMLTDDYLAIARWCEESALDLVVIDALSRAHSTDENKAVEFAKVLRRFDEISERTSTAILLVHHEPKTPGSGKELDDLDAVRGTSRMITDSKSLIRLVQIKKDELFCLRFAKTNNAAPIAPIYLTRPKNSGFEVTEYTPEQRKSENREKVRDALFRAGERGLTFDQVKEQTGLGNGSLNGRDGHLAGVGAEQSGEEYVVTDARGRRKTHKRWRLRSTEVEEGRPTPDNQLPLGDID